MGDDAATQTAELGSIDGLIAPAGELAIPVTDEGLLRGDGDPVPGDPAIARARRIGIPLLSAAMSTRAARRAAEMAAAEATS